MKRIVLKGTYNKKMDRVAIQWREYEVMGVNNISKNYDTSNIDKMIREVINDHRKIAKDIVTDSLEENDY